ncbi:hypothetical protein OAI47_01925 [Rhodospirillaceae bacterium]|nr:hypothetical protein [Rhodospirillaceae bacterium]
MEPEEKKQQNNPTEIIKTNETKTDLDSQISLAAFLSSDAIKLAEFNKWAKENKEDLNKQEKLLDVPKFVVTQSGALDRFLLIVPKLFDHRDRVIAKKIVDAIFRTHNVDVCERFPPAHGEVEKFLDKQKAYLDDNVKGAARIGDSFNTSGKKETEDLVLFEFKLLRLLLFFINNQPWLTPTFLFRAFSGFSEWAQYDGAYSFEKSLLTFGQNSKSSRYLLSIVEQFSRSFKETQDEVRQLRARSGELFQQVKTNDQKIIKLNDDIRLEKQKYSELKENLNREIQGRESDQRVTEVYEHDLKGKVRKTVSRIMKGELLLIKEMLSDGDEFHNQILHEVKSLEKQLEDMK